MPDPFKYHVFISYSHHDRPWVKSTLLPALESAGLRVAIDFRDFEVGEAGPNAMQRCVVESCKTIIVLTPAYIASEWSEFENIIAQTLDPAARRRRILPLMLEKADLPPRIAFLTYLDMGDPADLPRQFERLTRAIQRDCAAGDAGPAPTS